MSEDRRGGQRGAGVTIALVVLLLVGLLPGVAAADAAGCWGSSNYYWQSSEYEVCFNDPTGPEASRDRIVDRLKQLVRTAGPGDRIRVAMYKWTLDGIAVALRDAKEAGADVSVVLDDQAAGRPPYETMTAAGIPVTVCDRSCTSNESNSIQHNKFFLADVDGVKRVAVTSSNMNGPSKSGKYNDLIILRDAELYDFYSGYWSRLEEGSWTFAGTTWTPAKRKRTGSLATKAYVFERDDLDVVAAILNNVTACRDGDAKIWLALTKFTDSRSKVQKRLEELENIGCNVKLIIDRSVDEPFVQKGTSWDDSDPRTFLTKSKVRQMPGSTYDVHHKLLIVDANYNGRYQEVVFTGSHNFTGPALRKNDENWVRMEHVFVFYRYRSHFDELWARSTD